MATLFLQLPPALHLRRWAYLLTLIFALPGLTGAAMAASDDEGAIFDRQLSEQDIKALFPKATVIGEKDPQQNVYPVYQLQELLGYAFETNDFVDIKGFSGDRINILVALNTDGEIADLSLLKHHEPIFMHGLGPRPFLDFLDQYRGASLSDQIILGGKRSEAQAGSRVFDGITKATVSVIVANDTILSAAREAARLTLPAFAQQAPSEVRADYFEALDFPELLERGLVAQWPLSVGDLESALGDNLEHYREFSDDDIVDSEPALELYFAYINTPVTGRNLLGDEGYVKVMQYLSEGEHAIAVMARGPIPFLEPSFRPASIPQRLTLSQHALPIGIRDMNISFERLPQSLLDSGLGTDESRMKVFSIRAQSGFDPASEMELMLNFKLHKNPLVSDSASFSKSYQLPEALFIKREISTVKKRPLWQSLWLSRWLEIAVLCIGLLGLTVMFSQQRQLRKNAAHYPLFRSLFLVYTLYFIGFYAQGQLSVVNIYTLMLALRDGFSLDVFLLDPIIFILWCFSFVSLFIWGRGLFCGWLCPFGALQEFLSALAQRLRIPQYRPSDRLHSRLILIKYPVLLILMAVSLVSLSNAEKLAEIEPFKTSITLLFIREWPFVVYALVILGVGLFVQKAYCRYLCPLGAGLAILGRFRRLEWLDRRKECGSPCQLCQRRCQVNAIARTGEIDYDECVQCLECVVILDDPKQCAPVRAANKRRPRFEATEIGIADIGRSNTKGSSAC